MTTSNKALRFHSLAIVHGHQVEDINPSLVDALGAGNPAIAHDNPYSSLVAGDAAVYFRNDVDFSRAVAQRFDEVTVRFVLPGATKVRHTKAFTRKQVLAEYARLRGLMQSDPSNAPFRCCTKGSS